MLPRRLISLLLLCLVLGLGTTVAIAWTSAGLDTVSAQGMHRREFSGIGSGWGSYGTVYTGPRAERAMLRVVWPDFSDQEDSQRRSLEQVRMDLAHLNDAREFPRPWGCRPRIEDAGPIAPPPRGMVYPPFPPPPLPTWMQDARGWPALALWCEWRCATPSGSGVRGGIDLPLAAGPILERSLRALPYRPIPLGLAADTLIFALAWSALLFALRSIRRRIRIARNLCPACAYNLAGLPPQTPCPECGHAATSKP